MYSLIKTIKNEEASFEQDTLAVGGSVLFFIFN